MVLAVSYVSLLAELFLPRNTPRAIANGLDWPVELFPNNLASPLGWVLPFTGYRYALAVIFGLATAACWLAIRRWAPARLTPGRFLVALVVWPVASFAVVTLVVAIGALTYRLTHGG